MKHPYFRRLNHYTPRVKLQPHERVSKKPSLAHSSEPKTMLGFITKRQEEKWAEVLEEYRNERVADTR